MSADPVSAVISSLKRAHLIPDVLPESFVPSALFSIIYQGGKEVMLGNELALEETTDEPQVCFSPMTVPAEQAWSKSAGEEVAYTLVMLDPDVPSRADPQYKTFRHWVVPGLMAPADSTVATASSAALLTQAAITPYRPPGPRPGSGFHRYTFLLFQETDSKPLREKLPEGAPEFQNETLDDRRRWDGLAFAEKYGLKLVGANFMLVHARPAAEQ